MTTVPTNYATAPCRCIPALPILKFLLFISLSWLDFGEKGLDHRHKLGRSFLSQKHHTKVVITTDVFWSNNATSIIVLMLCWIIWKWKGLGPHARLVGFILVQCQDGDLYSHFCHISLHIIPSSYSLSRHILLPFSTSFYFIFFSVCPLSLFSPLYPHVSVYVNERLWACALESRLSVCRLSGGGGESRLIILSRCVCVFACVCVCVHACAIIHPQEDGAKVNIIGII